MASVLSVMRRGVVVAVAAWLCVVLLGMAGAEPLQVEFDSYPVVACRDVTPAGFSDLWPGEKVVEARIRVSLRVVAGSSEDLREVLFEIRSAERRLRIDQFEPQTRMDSDLLEPIQVTRRHEAHRSFGLGLGGSIAVPSSGVSAGIEPVANAGASRREVVTSTLKKRSSKRPIVISGTTHQGHGVFFKLRPSSQTSLEGVHDLKCLLRVPAAWRGDWLLLACRAEGCWTRYFVKADGVCGQARYVLGLHAAGDDEARAAAERLARVQWVAREVALDRGEVLAEFPSGPLDASSRALAKMSGSEL